MDSSMAPALTAAAASAHALGLPQRVVTSARDSQHTRGSLHPEGKGVDLRGNDISVAQGRQWARDVRERLGRSEEHTSELQSLMRISYAVFCLKKKKRKKHEKRNQNS